MDSSQAFHNEDEEDDDDDLTEDEIRGHVAAASEGGIHALQDIAQSKSNKWKHLRGSVAVMGESGAGKSSFINAMLGLTADDKGSAKVGCIQTTMEAEEYKHPDNISLSFWELPGVGTASFPLVTSLVKIHLDKYDCFITVTHRRFKKNELWLIKAIEKLKTKIYIG